MLQQRRGYSISHKDNCNVEKATSVKKQIYRAANVSELRFKFHSHGTVKCFACEGENA